VTRGAKNVILWVAQILLALFFLAAGVYHGLLPIEEAARSAPWADDLPVPLVRFIGFSELAGALGVVLPWLTGIRPRLTPLAALGLMTIMVLAALFHVWRGEAAIIGMHLVVAAIAAFVAWGRR
jgi:putative oxidoreductase